MPELVGVIGDIHGCYLTLTSLYNELIKYTSEIYTVGDLIDRGKKSRAVVDFVIENKIKTIRGNHEDVLLKAFEQIGTVDKGLNKSLIEIYSHHFKIGGEATFESYRSGRKPYSLFDYKSSVEDTGHIEFIESLPVMIELPKIVISHAGIVKDGTIQDIIWNRTKPLLKLNKLQIIGHTPQDEVLYKRNWYMNIDTGCIYGNKLTAILIDKNTAEVEHVLQLPNIDVYE